MTSRFQRRAAADVLPHAPEVVAKPERMPDPPQEAPTPVAEPVVDDQDTLEAGVPAPSPQGHDGTFWHRWQVSPALGNPGDPWEKQNCHQCLPQTDTLLVEPAGSRFYCTACGRHGDASVDPPHYVGLKAPLDDIIWPESTMDLDRVLEAQQFDAVAVRTLFPDLALVEGHFPPESPTPGWAPALRFDVRDEAGGALRDYLFVALDGDMKMGASARLPNGKAYPWGWDRITNDKVLFVDDPRDALALLLAGHSHTVCMPHTLNPARAGGGDWSAMALIESRMAKINRVELAFSDDDGGHGLEEELSRRMGRDRAFRTRWQNWPAEEGEVGCAYLTFLRHGEEGIHAELAALSPYPIVGIHELNDVDAEYEMLYDTGLLPGLMVGLPSLDQHYSVKLSQVTVLHGIPQHGKTTLLDEIMIQLALRYGWEFGVFSAENSKLARHFAALTEKLVGKPFTPGLDGVRVSVEEKNEAKRFLNKHVRMIRPDEEKGNWSLDGILDLARSLVFRHGIHGLVIDPWNELEHSRPMHLSHEEYLAQQLGKVKRFAEVNDVHVWIVAHPRTMQKDSDGDYPVPTPYSLSGGGMWFNKADFLIAVWRRRGMPDQTIMDIHVQKVRWKEDGLIGLLSLLFDELSNRFIDQVNHTKRLDALINKKVQIPLADQLISVPRPMTPLPHEADKFYRRAPTPFK